ncbi:vesicle-associated membrane protein 5-like isoform X2 [Oncorhynchus tshawytscha]|uniref:vesicle-associated membrane protein 5-like isoform X2 n=1 Tax=Oncorhynchus tshawytscha TaxID=74940 RepID=UPI000D0A1641|nr:vesicle-associated membrane protein 5-like isoform X2 [Oncorhynchus tshawytscha]
MFIIKSMLTDEGDKEKILPSQENGKNRLQQAQKEVEEVKVIMLDNLNKADERSGKLGELENRADELLEKSKAFSKSAGRVKQQKWWEHMKMKVLLSSIGVVVAAIIIGIVVWTAFGPDDRSSNSSTPVEQPTSGP